MCKYVEVYCLNDREFVRGGKNGVIRSSICSRYIGGIGTKPGTSVILYCNTCKIHWKVTIDEDGSIVLGRIKREDIPVDDTARRLIKNV